MTPIATLGQFSARVLVRGTYQQVEFIVTTGNGGSLLSYTAARAQGVIGDSSGRGAPTRPRRIQQVEQGVPVALLRPNRLLQPACRQAAYQQRHPTRSTQAAHSRHPAAPGSGQGDRQHAGSRHHRASDRPDAVGLSDRAGSKGDTRRSAHHERRPRRKSCHHALKVHLPDHRRSRRHAQQRKGHQQARFKIGLQPTCHRAVVKIHNYVLHARRPLSIQEAEPRHQRVV